MWKKKNINKAIVWAVLWSAIAWIWLFSRTKKWKSFFQRLKSDVNLWLKEINKTIKKLINKNGKKK